VAVADGLQTEHDGQAQFGVQQSDQFAGPNFNPRQGAGSYLMMSHAHVKQVERSQEKFRRLDHGELFGSHPLAGGHA
jgi:hypothetical protein